MATSSSFGSRHWPPDAELTPSPLGHYFDDPQQHELLDEDYAAGRSVATELIAVIGAALLLGLVAVTWIVAG